MVSRIWIVAACGLLLTSLASCALGGKYCLAFWRETGFYEKGGIGGNHVINVHVWDENGTPLAGRHIYVGTLDMGATDANGQVELAIYEPNSYPLKVVDGANTSDTTPGFSSTRAPDWGHYCFECGFVYKSDTSSLPSFDLAYDGIFNSSSADYACDNIQMSAPRTRSLAFCSTKPDPGFYCSDGTDAGSTVASVGQTFRATGNRVVACKFHALGGNAQYVCRIREGGPTGPYVGSSAVSPYVGTYEYGKTLTRWGLDDVQVVSGNTYFLEITRLGGGTFYANRVVHNNDPYGCYYEGATAFPDRELRGEVVCATVGTTPDLGAISGFVRYTSSAPIAGAAVSTDAGGYSTSTASDGSYTLSSVAPGTYSVTASKSGYNPQTNSGVVVTAGQTTTSSFTLTPNSGTISGYVRDSSSAPIQGATVATSTGGYSTTTASNGSYTLTSVAPGTYSVTASRSGYGSQTNNGIVVNAGQTTTCSFTLSCIAPSITTHPRSQVRAAYQSAVFAVGASGTPPFSYQWRKNGANIAGATASSYSVHCVSAGDAAAYDCVVANSCGSATSNAAVLTVVGASGAWDSDKMWSCADYPTKLSGTGWDLEGTSGVTTENWGTSYGVGATVYDRNNRRLALIIDNNGSTSDSGKCKYRTDGAWSVDPNQTIAVKAGFYAIDSAGAYPALYIRGNRGVQIKYDDSQQAWTPGSGAVLGAGSPSTLPVPLCTWHYIRFQMDPLGNWQAWLNEDPDRRMWGTAPGDAGGPYVQVGCLGSTTSNVEFGLDFVAWGQGSAIPDISLTIPAATISEAKAYPDGTTVRLSGKPVTASTGSAFWVEESDRSSGIKVEAANSLAVGTIVTVTGDLSTVAGERVLRDATFN